MRLLLIRHADPDYENDSLTEKGKREAALLAKVTPQMNLGEVYISPLGRAQATAACSLEACRKEGTTLSWLEEFHATVDLGKHPEMRKAYPEMIGTKGNMRWIVWDMIPSYLLSHPEYYERTGWRTSELAYASKDLVSLYDETCRELDALLAKHGYIREGLGYRVVKESTDTITLFCHFGMISVLLSHLCNLSPFAVWHNFILAPSSVTEVITEEREQGIAIFRTQKAGDISHLCLENEEPAFAGRFTEVYSDMTKRH